MGKRFHNNFKTDKELFAFNFMFTPFWNQSSLTEIISTPKMVDVIYSIISKYIDDTDISDFQKYSILFIYADLNGDNFLSLIKKYIRNIKSDYIIDQMILKLLDYYRHPSRKKVGMANDILDLIAELKMKLKGYPKKAKGKLIQDIKNSLNRTN